jgi:predicted RNase H-like HicB family nuclease
MTELIFIVEESLEGGFEAKAMGANIFTQGDDLKDLKLQIKEAVSCHFESADLPSIIRLHFVKEEVFSI